MELEYTESQFEPLPVGAFEAIYQGAEDFAGDGQYGPSIRLKFVIVGGEVRRTRDGRLVFEATHNQEQVDEVHHGADGTSAHQGGEDRFGFDQGDELLLVTAPKEKGDGTAIVSIVKK
jgi:hypothetical protein